MKRENRIIGHSIGIFELLGVLFIALKLTDTVDWSWWLVLAPLWIHIIVYGFLLLALVFAVCAYIVNKVYSLASSGETRNG
jgi:hypothetical protein